MARSATRSFARNDAALVQQRVDERRLAVVDVRDDGDVAPERVGDVGTVGTGRDLLCGR